jgi:hypothetical protein
MAGVKTMEFDTLVPSLYMAFGIFVNNTYWQLQHWCQGVVPTCFTSEKSDLSFLFLNLF